MLSRVIAKNVGDVFLRHSVLAIGSSLTLTRLLYAGNYESPLNSTVICTLTRLFTVNPLTFGISSTATNATEQFRYYFSCQEQFPV